MYSDVFCKVYNEFGWNYYPEIFGEQLLVWLRRKGLSPENSMDLACGTGVLCRILKANGIESHGMQRMYRYYKSIQKGMIHPENKGAVVFEPPRFRCY